jgi:hypothetical protein
MLLVDGALVPEDRLFFKRGDTFGNCALVPAAVTEQLDLSLTKQLCCGQIVGTKWPKHWLYNYTGKNGNVAYLLTSNKSGSPNYQR